MELLRVLKKRIRKFIVSRKKIINRYICDIGFETDGVYLIATKQSLLQLKGKRLYQVLRGNFYGLTKTNKTIYAFQRLRPNGRILELQLNEDYWITASKIFMSNLSPGCHQLDIYRGTLYVCDSYNNRIIQMNLIDKNNMKYHYPMGALENGRESKNYGHINSIYLQENGATIICHNTTQKTSRPSQILILDKDFSLSKVIDTPAGSAHNVIPYGDLFLYCDSMNGNLNLDDKIVFKASCFTRGLSMNHNYILLGGSEYAKRDMRNYGRGYLFILDRKDFNLRHCVELPSMVQEIRRLDSVDFGLSDNGTK
jgi:hypothetical protein